MKLWMSLYGMIWIVFFEFLLVMPSVTGGATLMALHVVAGVLLLGLAFSNYRGVRKTKVPARVKRTARATLHLSIVMAVLGGLLLLDVGADWAIPVLAVTIRGILLFFHVVNAFAIITQAAAVAIAYDMWEEREFSQETEPGAVPRKPPAPRSAERWEDAPLRQGL